MNNNSSSCTFAVQCREIFKTFSEGPLDVAVLKGVNLSISQGEQVAIVGMSGSGKSTLLHIIGGLSEPSSGQVLIDGQDINVLSQREQGDVRNTKLGFVYQFHHLLQEFSALENVAMPLLIRRDDGDSAVDRAAEILEHVGLADRLQHKPGELSGGERQRVAIARAMVTRPACIMADEPTGNLDEQTAASIHELLLELNHDAGTSLIVVTHNLALAGKADRIFKLENGILVAKD